MLVFRLYEVDRKGHITGPSQAIECESEEQAVGEARRRLSVLPLEIWRGKDMIRRLEPAA